LDLPEPAENLKDYFKEEKSLGKPIFLSVFPEENFFMIVLLEEVSSLNLSCF